MVPRKGLEPSRLAALEPKSSVSTNSTTWAQNGADYTLHTMKSQQRFKEQKF